MMNSSENSSQSHHAIHDPIIKSTKTERSENTSRCPIRRRLFLRRRKLPTIRLGGRGRWGFFLRRVKMKSLKIKLRGMIKKIKSYCRNLAKDIFEAGSNMDYLMQDAVVFETAFAIPVMSLTFNSLPAASNHYRMA